MSHPTAFGVLLRASRLRYGHCVPLDAWMRVTPNGDDTFFVELVPHNQQVPTDGKGRSRMRYLWWEGDKDGHELVASSPYLSKLGRVTKPHSFNLDFDGELIQ